MGPIAEAQPFTVAMTVNTNLGEVLRVERTAWLDPLTDLPPDLLRNMAGEVHRVTVEALGGGA